MKLFRNGFIVLFIALSLLVMGVSSSFALPSLSYTVEDLGSGNWRYNYTISNDFTDRAINSFSVDFAYGLYDALILETPVPSGWEQSYVYSPDYTSAGFGNGALWGFPDVSQLIAPGSSLSGFAVSFVWFPTDFQPLNSIDGIVADGDQAFTCSTIPYNESNSVPEPGTIVLLSIGLAGLTAFRLRRK